MKTLALWTLRTYQRWVSPMLPPSCRYIPTCSEYAIEAIETSGLLRGGFIAIGRLLRCHPFVNGGYDPVHRSHCYCTCHSSALQTTTDARPAT
jgi:uncharacterized protein